MTDTVHINRKMEDQLGLLLVVDQEKEWPVIAYMQPFEPNGTQELCCSILSIKVHISKPTIDPKTPL